MWTAHPGPKVFVYKAYRGRIEDRKEVLNIRNAIKETLRLKTNPTVAIPIPKLKVDKKDNAPLCALIKGITESEAQDLIDRVRATPDSLLSEPLYSLAPNVL